MIFFTLASLGSTGANVFYDGFLIFGKFASITGPLLLGVTAQITGRSNAGIVSLIVLFVIGMIVLSFVPSDKMFETPAKPISNQH